VSNYFFPGGYISFRFSLYVFLLFFDIFLFDIFFRCFPSIPKKHARYPIDSLEHTFNDPVNSSASRSSAPLTTSHSHKCDWLNYHRRRIWLNETYMAKTCDWLNCQHEGIWLDESQSVKSSDWLNSGRREIRLNESHSVKSSDWLNSGPREIWLDESQSVK
jgi:hypothetical protein